MLQSLEIKNFTVFEEANLEFSAGLNIIIGENGTGKTHLLKLGYLVLRGLHSKFYLNQSEAMNFPFDSVLMSFYRPDSLKNLINHQQDEFLINAKLFKDGLLRFQQSREGKSESMRSNPEKLNFPKPLFIPTREIMSVYTGFAGALRNRELEFDGTFLDLADALELTPLKSERAELVLPIIKTLEKQMEGKVIFKNGRFYIAKGEEKLEITLVAEGIRKIAMLTYLIMNGSIQKGSTLFWDEPESNLNPKMMVQLAETLVILSNMGIQIFIATHSLFLLREIKIQLLQHPEAPARYFALQLEGKSVSVQQGDSMDEVEPIAALDASLEQSDRYLELV